MSDQITTAFVQQFSQGIEMLVQQTGSVLRGAVRVEPVKGKQAFFDQIGKQAATRPTDRHADSPLNATPHARRRVTTVPVEVGDLVDDFDKVRVLNEPTNAYSQSMAMAIGREIDIIIIEQLFATAFTGETGATSTTFPAGNQIAASSANLTVAKLRSGVKTLRTNMEQMPREPVYIAVTMSQLDSMLGETEVTSSDFNVVKALVQGEVDTFIGAKFIQTELLETDSSSDRRCPLWAKSGMLLALGMNPKSRITERADKRFSTYVYYSMDAGATRMQEPKMVEIKCTE